MARGLGSGNNVALAIMVGLAIVAGMGLAGILLFELLWEVMIERMSEVG